MILAKKEVELLFKLYTSMMIYANNRLNVFSQINNSKEFHQLDAEDKLKVRDKVFENSGLILEFVEENPFDFSAEELKIVENWQNFIKGEFVIYKQYKKYCVFLSTENPDEAYGVVGLFEPIEAVVPFLPAYTSALLLPFKDKIIYDGFLSTYSVHFGGGIKANLKDQYEHARAQNGIIEQLPHIKPSKEEAQENLLRYYLKSEKLSEYYEEEIEDILEEYPNLLEVYHIEIAKRAARRYKKRLKKLQVIEGWFAIFNDVIIASGKTKDEARENAARVLPKQMKEWIHLIKVKSSGS